MGACLVFYVSQLSRKKAIITFQVSFLISVLDGKFIEENIYIETQW